MLSYSASNWKSTKMNQHNVRQLKILHVSHREHYIITNKEALKPSQPTECVSNHQSTKKAGQNLSIDADWLPVVACEQQRILRYLGHILRVPDSRVERLALMALSGTGTHCPEASLLMDHQTIPLKTIEELALWRSASNTMVNRLP